MAVSSPAVFKRLGSRLGPAARLSGGPDPADGMVSAARPAGSNSAAAVDSTAATPGVDASSVVNEDPAASSGMLRTSGSDNSSTGAHHGVRLAPPAAAAPAAAVSTPLSGIGGAAAGATGAGAAAPHAQPTARPALYPVGEDEEEEETVPLGHNPLARRVLAGRQSLAPCRHQVLASTMTPRIVAVIWNVSN